MEVRLLPPQKLRPQPGPPLRGLEKQTILLPRRSKSEFHFPRPDFGRPRDPTIKNSHIVSRIGPPIGFLQKVNPTLKIQPSRFETWSLNLTPPQKNLNFNLKYLNLTRRKRPTNNSKKFPNPKPLETHQLLAPPKSTPNNNQSAYFWWLKITAYTFLQQRPPLPGKLVISQLLSRETFLINLKHLHYPNPKFTAPHSSKLVDFTKKKTSPFLGIRAFLQKEIIISHTFQAPLKSLSHIGMLRRHGIPIQHLNRIKLRAPYYPNRIPYTKPLM